jgi:hypothetical protein
MKSTNQVEALAFFAHKGLEAAREYQKLLDHRGIMIGDPVSSLAGYGLARSYALSGDASNARNQYKELLTLCSLVCTETWPKSNWSTRSPNRHLKLLRYPTYNGVSSSQSCYKRLTWRNRTCSHVLVRTPDDQRELKETFGIGVVYLW